MNQGLFSKNWADVGFDRAVKRIHPHQKMLRTVRLLCRCCAQVRGCSDCRLVVQAFEHGNLLPLLPCLALCLLNAISATRMRGLGYVAKVAMEHGGIGNVGCMDMHTGSSNARLQVWLAVWASQEKKQRMHRCTQPLRVDMGRSAV